MKIRRVDFSPDEFLVGVAGLSAEEIGLYWVICCLIYSSGGPIDPADERLQRLSGVSRQRLPHLLKVLVSRRQKLDLEGGLLSNKRATIELAKAELRLTSASSNGKLGGRPLKNINDLEKPDGFGDGKLSLSINHQPSTINHQDSIGSPRKARGAILLPKDWKPDDPTYATRLGLSGARAVAELTKFIGYFTVGKGAAKRRTDRGWNQSYMNWIARAVERGGGSDEGHTQKHRPLGPAVNTPEWHKLMRENGLE